MQKKTLGNKLFKSGKILISVAGAVIITANILVPSVGTVLADGTTTSQHTNSAPYWVANNAQTIAKNIKSQGITSVNDLANYKVIWGDTLSGIANHFHTTTAELKSKFNIVNADFIVAGYQLRHQSQFNQIGQTLLFSATNSFSTTNHVDEHIKSSAVVIVNNSNNDNHGADKAATDKAAAADKAVADKAAADKAAADKAATDKAAADKAAADKAVADKAAADKAAAEQAAADKAATDKATADKVAADKAAADKAAADKAAADKAAADKAAADKAAADKAAAEQTAADKAAADKAAAPLNMNLLASGMDTIGKYAQRLHVNLSGFDARPTTITQLKVSENGLIKTYTKEQLQRMGINVNVKDSNNFLSIYIPAQNGSKGWDTSNLTVSVDLQLENGITKTLSDHISPSPSNGSDDETSDMGSEEAAKQWIASRESGNNYNARNGQFIGKYQINASYFNGDYSPANQERVANQYVQSRYGSWINAKNFWQSHHWY